MENDEENYCHECGELMNECEGHEPLDDGQPDLMQEYDDLYGYGPEFDVEDYHEDW